MKTKENSIEKDIEKYFKEVSKALPQEGRKSLLPDIKAGVDSYLVENPGATIDDVISYVGTPECIANEYYANQEGTKITREIKTSRLILTVIISVVLLVMVIYIGFMLHAVIKDVLGIPAYYEEVLEIDLPFEVSDSDMSSC